MSKGVDWDIKTKCGYIVYTCDNCGKEEVYEFKDGNLNFEIFEKYLIEKGWVISRLDEEVCEFCCPECLEKFQNEGECYDK